MSKPGKVFLIAGLLFFAVLYIFRITYGGWHDSMWVPLVFGFFLTLFGVIKERVALTQFFTMRTTKHGLNMGAVILFAILGLICLNVLAVRYDKKFDWTSDKLNTLSDQSVKVAAALNRPTELLLLFRNEEQGGENVQKVIGDLAKMYRNQNARISYRAVNALKDPAAAQKFDYNAGPFALFAVQGEKKVKIDQPTEEGVTRALIKLGRESKKAVYYVTGHGERDLEAKDEDGVSFLKEQLSVTYDVRPLALYQSSNRIPEDAAAVLIVRPNQQYLEPELQGLRDYLKRGGHLFMAIDPGMKHNLAQLTKSVGIEFDNDYVLDQRARMAETGPATVVGSTFPSPSDITKAFGESQFAVFYLASSLKKAPDASPDFDVQPLIATDNGSMSTPELGQVVYKPNGPHTLGMTAKLPAAASAVVFGDSDFVSNRFVQNNLNNDLALNSVAWLTDDRDLISIRPKQAQGSTLEMTSEKFNFYVLGFLLLLPIVFFGAGSMLWWKRKTA